MPVLKQEIELNAKNETALCFVMSYGAIAVMAEFLSQGEFTVLQILNKWFY